MFTRCPECSTVFRVTANQLRVAQGDVRCGNCAHVFNATEFLTDEVPEAERRRAADTGADTPQGVAEPTTEPAAESGAESLEFDAPEQTWSEIFIEAPSLPPDIALDGELETITADPDEWQSMLSELGVEPPSALDEPELPAAGEAAAELSDEEPAWDADSDTGEYPEPVYLVDQEAAPLTADDPEAADETDDDGPEWLAPAATESAPPWDELPAAEKLPVTSPHLWRWTGVAAVLLITLAAQLVHYSRDSLAAHPRYGELVRSFYARFDSRLYPDWPLSAFSVRRSEALAGGSAPNALDISAAVEVAGAHPVGLPLVRVTLRDQWANTVGTRVFLPEEYLATELPDIVAPGTRIGVALSLADPGTEARGYEVDLCLQRRQAGLECQLAQAPFRQ